MNDQKFFIHYSRALLEEYGWEKHGRIAVGSMDDLAELVTDPHVTLKNVDRIEFAGSVDPEDFLGRAQEAAVKVRAAREAAEKAARVAKLEAELKALKGE